MRADVARRCYRTRLLDMLRLAFASVAVLAGCNSTTNDPIPADFGVPADIPSQPITVDGGTVYLADGSIYGPCELIEPHKDDLTGWVSIPPEQPGGDFGFVCTD